MSQPRELSPHSRPAVAALAATGLVAGYRRRRRTTPIVRAARLEAAGGELTAVVGPNGTGKSTLLRTLVGAQPPLAGTVEVDGRRLDHLDRRSRARHLAVVLTDRVDPGRLTVGEVVALGRHPHTGWTGHLAPDDVAQARRAADLVDAGSLWHRPFDELSDGQRQRVLVARALAQEPALIVLDEPTAFLDLPGRAGLTATLSRLARRSGVAAVVSTHDLDLALGHADRMWVVADGTVATGAPEDLLADGTLARAFAHDGLTLDPATGLMRPALPRHPAVTVAGSTTARVLAVRAAARCGVRVVESVGDLDPAPWAVVADDDGWTLRCGRHEHRGTTFDDLARTLRAHLDPEPADQEDL
jgi:iron complex transport system ATP-binding protein